MTRVVLDANVLVSGFPDVGSVPGALIERWLRGQFELVLSEHILDGVSRAWNKPYYRNRYRKREAQQALALLRERAMIVSPEATVHGVGEDLEDDLVLATAIAGQASSLVTGDKWLQEVGHFQDVAIISPRQFLTWLEGEAVGRGR